MKTSTIHLLFTMGIVLLIAQGCKKDAITSTKNTASSNSFPTSPLPYFVSTIAGSEDGGFYDAVGLNARFYGPRGITAMGGTCM